MTDDAAWGPLVPVPVHFDRLPPSDGLRYLFGWLAGETARTLAERAGVKGQAVMGPVSYTGGSVPGERSFEGTFWVEPLTPDGEGRGRPCGPRLAYRGRGEAHVPEDGRCTLAHGIAEPGL